VLTGFATQGRLEFAKGLSEGVIVGTNEFVAFFTAQKEVELGDRLDLKGLGSLAVVVRLHGAKHDVLVPVSASGSLESRFEAHAGTTPR